LGARRLNWIKEKFKKFSMGRYGMDELGKVLVWVSIILCAMGGLLNNLLLMFLSFVAVLIFFYRVLSRQIYDRSEENCKFQQYVKSWKLKYEYRKTARIYMCPQCGKMNRVPKGKGKIQITCANCGKKMTRYT
jgi:DNA-directed RNA polymerase subunit RPC12/RpoP